MINYLINIQFCTEKAPQWQQTFEELVKLIVVVANNFGSLGLIFKEKLAFKSCKICGWQKCLQCMGSYILCKILRFEIPVAQKVFNTCTWGSNSLRQLIVLCTFSIQN